MKRFGILFSLSVICSLACHGLTTEYDTYNELPIVFINTVNAEEPTCDYVEPPEGGVSLSIANATKVPGTLTIKQGDKILYESGTYIKGESGMTVKIRGNTSAYLPKKPYKIKLQKKADLLTRGDNHKYQDKDWLLLKSGDVDLNTTIGFKVNELVGIQWTPAYKYVELVMNGDYRGIYMLCESVKRNPDCRIDIGKDGFIAEYDAYWWNENIYLDSSIMSLFKYTFKYPDEENMTEDMLGAIKSSINSMENSIMDRDYDNYWDVNSLVSWVIAQDILGNSDGWGSNIYFTKYCLSNETKYKMGTLWDFDMVMNTTDRFSSSHTKWIFEFLSSDENFMKLYREKWISIGGNICLSVINWLKEFKDSNIAIALDTARRKDAVRWDGEYNQLSDDVDKAMEWFRNRLQWMNMTIGEADVSSIDLSVVHKGERDDTAVYNLQGQKVSQRHRGIIYIVNGKKYIQR